MIHHDQVREHLRLGAHLNPPTYSADPIIISASQPSAINDQDMAVNVIAGRGTKKHRRTGNVLRLAPTAGRNSLENLATADGVTAQRGCVGRRHVAWSNGVHIDSLGRPFVRERFRQLGDAALGCGVRGYKNTALKRKQGSNVYNFPGLPLLEHLLTCKLREAKDSAKVDGNHLVPIFSGEFRRGCAPNGAGVIHEDVDGAKVSDRFLDQLRTDFGNCNIAREIKYFPPQPSNFIAGASWVRITSVTADVCSCLRQRDRNSCAETFVRPGDQRVLAVQLDGFETRRPGLKFVDCLSRFQRHPYFFRPVSNPEPPRSKP